MIEQIQYIEYTYKCVFLFGDIKNEKQNLVFILFFFSSKNKKKNKNEK